jgi:hypothetical protein
MQREKLASYNSNQRLRERGVHQWNVCSKILRHFPMLILSKENPAYRLKKFTTTASVKQAACES